MSQRYHYQELRDFATAILREAGMSGEPAETVAEILVEGDLLGHTTHGLQLLSPYLKSLEKGNMTPRGEPRVVNDRGGTITWDGNYLPGPWLVVKAIELAESRVRDHGVVTVNIRRSHHIACLQAYLKRVTDRGYLILLTCSDPSDARVAPHGGLKPLYTPNPFACGIPTRGDPILLDISMSATAVGMTMRLHKQGKRLPHPWIKDAQGNPTDNPAVLFNEPAGTILPLGGMDLGYKGFALGMVVEALTSALGGVGRAEGANRWGASVFLQIIDPAAFGGADAFLKETDWFVSACHANPVKAGDPSVRLPGEAGLKRRQEQLDHGVDLYPGIMDSLRRWATKYEVGMPKPITG